MDYKLQMRHTTQNQNFGNKIHIGRAKDWSTEKCPLTSAGGVLEYSKSAGIFQYSSTPPADFGGLFWVLQYSTRRLRRAFFSTPVLVLRPPKSMGIFEYSSTPPSNFGGLEYYHST